jgi:hypothetical protein
LTIASSSSLCQKFYAFIASNFHTSTSHFSFVPLRYATDVLFAGMRLTLNLRSLLRAKQTPIGWRHLRTSPESVRRKSTKIPGGYGQLFAVGSLCVVIASLANYQHLKQIFNDTGLLAKSVAKSHSPRNSFAGYVERKDLEKTITVEMTKIPNKKYSIVYGNKAIGKSSVVRKCAAGKKGYVTVPIAYPESPKDVLESLMRVLHLGKSNLSPNQLLVAEEMRRVNDKYGIYPVIIFEVEGGGILPDGVVMNNVRCVAKGLAHLCNVLIVISDSNAIIQFGKDPTREKYIFVDEFSIPEATAYLKNHLAEMTEEEMKTKIFDQIGTNPGYLHDLIIRFKEEEIPIETLVDETVDSARKDLNSFPLQTILKALKDLPDSGDGVAPEYFNNQQENGVDLKDIGMVMSLAASKRSSPILYRKDTKKYHLLSTAHKTALKAYHPKRPFLMG